MVAYGSKCLTKSERRYSVTRKELLAVITFISHFRQYLLGSHFTLRTDHNARYVVLKTQRVTMVGKVGGIPVYH